MRKEKGENKKEEEKKKTKIPFLMFFLHLGKSDLAFTFNQLPF